MSSSSRLFYLDLLRSLAICGVIVLHTVNQLFATALFAFTVPLFTVISGTLNLKLNSGQILPYYRKRFFRLVIPLFIWSLLYFLWLIVRDHPPSLAFPLLQIFFFGQPFYFIWAIVGLSLMTPFLVRLLTQLSIKETSLLVVMILILTTISITSRNWFIPSGQQWTLIGLTQFIPYLGYYVLGWLIPQLSIKLKSIWLLSFVFGIAIVYYFVLYRLVTPVAVGSVLTSDFQPLTIIMVLSLFNIAFNIKTSRIPVIIQQVLTRLSKASYGIYFIHIFILEWISQPIGTIIKPPLFLSISLFIIALSGSWLIYSLGQAVITALITINNHS